MSWILKQGDDQIAVSGGWNPSLFSDRTGASFPAEVPTDWNWEHEDFTLSWEADPDPEPPSADELLQSAKASQCLQAGASSSHLSEMERTSTSRRFTMSLRAQAIFSTAATALSDALSTR